MDTLRTLEALRARIAEWKRSGARVGFVPTMGNLHAGHFALVDMARQRADRVVASIFVNPTQFGPNEDYARYPRTPERDVGGLRLAGCDLLFLPAIETMYPFGTLGCVQMHVPGITDILCGLHRPGHFNGVATVVARLFNMVQPDLAVFGAKDYQQLQVIRYMARELSFPLEIVPAPTLREADGLAMSSRNQYLSDEERQTASRIHQTLLLMRERAGQGQAIDLIEAEAERALRQAGFEVDYAEIRRDDLSRPRRSDEPGLRGFIAARIGRTRLIDNLPFADERI
jgi:pantoate--beta-alanine ligase